MKRILSLVLSLICCTSIFAAPIKEMIFFGDSLSDNGNLYSVLKTLPKSPPYYKGRFTNGFTWAEDLGNYFYKKSYIDYSIYAWGGATAIIHNPKYDKFTAPMILEEELALYLSKPSANDKSNILYIIWIGANDYLWDVQPDMDSLCGKVVNKISWAVETLIQHGAQHFLILNLPNLSRTPYANSTHTGERLNTLTVLHNQKLATAIKNLNEKYKNVDIVSVDIFSLFNDFLDNTAKVNQKYNVNIQNTTEPCLVSELFLHNNMNRTTINDDLLKGMSLDTRDASAIILNSPALAVTYATGKSYEMGTIPCEHAEQYLFWDELHPTETIHSVLAQMVEEILTNNSQKILK